MKTMLATTALAETPYSMTRLGIIMRPDAADPYETGGVLNPAVTRGPDGQLYLLPRLVAEGNYSRIGLARVVFDRSGDPVDVERMGIVLEPEAPYELNPRTGGGVEDPRVTYIPALGQYVMTYTAYSASGPRIALARSRDLLSWERMGLVRFAPHHGIDLDARYNKDAMLFPEPITAPDGRPALALLHRPAFDLPQTVDGRAEPMPLDVSRPPSIWISYAPLDTFAPGQSLVFGQHHLVAAPRRGWEHLKIGAGTPPIRVPGGWLVYYHGVSGHIVEGVEFQQHMCYSAGALLLDARDPRRVLYRGARTVLSPQSAAECHGIVPRVVFPTGLDIRPDGALDVYYGMADWCIGVARAYPAGVMGHTPVAA